MPLFDQHLHSKFSFDSKTEPEENVRQALARGLAGLTFTEHLDTHPEDWPKCVYDDEPYSAAIRELREKYRDQIWIGKGIEVCYQPENMDFILNFLQSHEFDVVLFSVHYFRGRSVHKVKNWEGLTAHEATRVYLEEVLQAVRFVADLHSQRGPIFHVLGHLDLVKRYSQRFLGSYDVRPFDDLITAILETCLAADLVPEINTSSLRQGLNETMPNLDTIRLYAELGGRAVSLGSDAHRAEDIAAGFDTALSMWQAVGIDRIAVFRGRRREEEPLR